MKGVIDIEFILSTGVFLGTILFVSFIIIANIPVFHTEAEREDLRSRAYQISQLLMFEKGAPENWEPANVQTIGLSTNEHYILNESKITNLNQMCQNDYTQVKNMLGQDFRTSIKIDITDSKSNQLLSCAPQTEGSKRAAFQITRFATLADKRIVRIEVVVF